MKHTMPVNKLQRSEAEHWDGNPQEGSLCARACGGFAGTMGQGKHGGRILGGMTTVLPSFHPFFCQQPQH